MCDLLSLSSAHPYRAYKSIPLFALLGQRNCHGWGIGYFNDQNEGVIHKSESPVYKRGKTDPKLEKLSSSISSKYILGHLRLASIGKTCDSNCHPFSLSFLGKHWIFVHNGTCPDIKEYETPGKKIEEATNDSARLFEFLRDKIIKGFSPSNIKIQELYRIIENAVISLFENYSGTYNFLLGTNSMLFAFSHHCPFWILHRTKEQGDCLILTTIEEGLTDGEEWFSLGNYDEESGNLFLIVEDKIILNEEIAKGM